jgi:hypothetical protein
MRGLPQSEMEQSFMSRFARKPISFRSARSHTAQKHVTIDKRCHCPSKTGTRYRNLSYRMTSLCNRQRVSSWQNRISPSVSSVVLITASLAAWDFSDSVAYERLPSEHSPATMCPLLTDVGLSKSSSAIQSALLSPFRCRLLRSVITVPSRHLIQLVISIASASRILRLESSRAIRHFVIVAPKMTDTARLPATLAPCLEGCLIDLLLISRWSSQIAPPHYLTKDTGYHPKLRTLLC